MTCRSVSGPPGSRKIVPPSPLHSHQIPSSSQAENEQIVRFVFVWQTIHTLLTTFRPLGQWGYVGKAPPQSSKSRTTRPSSSNASHPPTMHSNTSGVAETPAPPPISSKRTFGSRTSFLRRDDAGPSPVAPPPVPSIPAPPPPPAPEFRVPDTKCSIVTRQSALPIAAEAPGNLSVVSILILSDVLHLLTNIDRWYSLQPLRWHPSDFLDIPVILFAQREPSLSF